MTDLDRRLESLIPQDADLVVTCDRNGFNAGSMIVRCCQPLREIFEEALKRRDEFDWPNGLNEQNALTWLLWKVKDRVCILPQRELNSYALECDAGSDTWQPGHFVLHCPSAPNSVRIKALTDAVLYAAKADRE